jgi:hypothetical protein
MSDSLRRACQRLVDGLDLPLAAVGIRDVLPVIERLTGRAVVLAPASFGASAPCGIWVRTESSDHVFYDPDTSRAHQDHIIAHELGHILRGHRPNQDLSPALVPERLLSTLDPVMVRKVLGRTGYEQREEQEAETIASLLQSRIHRRGLPAADDRAARTLLTRRRL